MRGFPGRLVAFCLGLSAIASSAGQRPHAADPAAAARRHPNIIYVMTDDQGYGDIAAHGNPVISTPNLDRLHAESVRLTEFHASPTCAPTRAALLTGRHEFRSGVTHTIFERERLALSAVTLPQLLRRCGGYSTGIFGKWHLGDEDEYQPGKRGFDRVFIHGGGGIGQSYPGSCGDAPGNTYFDPVIRSDGTFVKTKGYCTDVFFDAALEWIATQRRGDKPFFCYLTPNAPHDPLDCPPGSDNPYLAKLAAAGVADPKQRERIAKFYGMIENIDTNMGRLLAQLDEWGLAEDTLVVFTTDNGTATGAAVCNDGMRGHKGTVYRGGTRVPSFWRWKGTLPAGRDVPAVTAHIDVLPTLCELAGAAIPPAVSEKVEGRSLVPLMRDASAAWPDRPLFTHLGRWDRGQAAKSKYRQCRLRASRWSLVNTKNRADSWELYDLAADPGEKTDVSATHADVVERLAATYDAWWRSVQPDLVNENRDGPAENPFKTAYRKQFGPRPPAATRVKRPNILYIIADDQSPFDLKCYNPASTLSAPRIERLAAEGMVFDAAYHMGSFSGAVCTPSRHMVMCGRSVWHLPIGPQTSRRQGAAAARCPPDIAEFTLAPVFNQAGYDTMRTCKQGNAYEAADRLFTVRHDATKRGGTHAGGSGWHADRVLDYLAERDRTDDAEPFLIYLGFSHPHDTRDGTPELLDKYGATNHADPSTVPAADPRQPPLPASWLPKHPFDPGHMDVRDEVAVSGVWKNRDERTIRNERGREFACIENIDSQIGRVLDKLAAMGELENTWIFYTADHGIALGRHGLQGKQNLYEHTWRVPFIVKGPGVKPGSRAAGNIYLGDSLATLCDIAGIPCPETNEGTSFVPVLEGKQQAVRDVLYGVYCGGQKPGIRSVRRGDWKLVKYESPSGGLHTQLFNLKDNPQEFVAEHHDPSVAEVLPTPPLPSQRDLAADPAHALTRAELETLLLAEMQRHDDPYRFSDQKRPPNIVLFVADDLGYGELGCYGNAAALTPNLDRFAAEGLRLTDCHSASSCCSPSRSSLLTGRHPYRNGVFTWIPENSPIHLRTSEVALPKLLAQAGYQTCHVGKWHLNGMFNSPEQPQPGDHGYDWWLATQNNAAPSHAFPENFVRNGVAIGKVEDYSAPFVVKEAIQWLQTKRDPSQPFFLAVWTHEPHYPIASAERYEKQHAAIEDPEERTYRANITQLDDAFGMLMKTLDDIGAADSTLVFFTSDNGPEGAGDKGPGRGLAGPLRGRKRSMYEGGHRVPGIIRWPRHVQPGAESHEPVIGSDFFPTAVAAAGLEPPAGRTLDGANLLPCLEGRGVDRSRPLCWRWGGFIAYREGPWKIVVDEALKQPELFNLADDLSETTDLAAREPERLAGMLERLRTLTAEIEAEGPDWWKTEPLNGRRRTPVGNVPAPAG